MAPTIKLGAPLQRRIGTLAGGTARIPRSPAGRAGSVFLVQGVPEDKTVKNRMHLAQVFRRLRRIPEVVRIQRLKKKPT